MPIYEYHCHQCGKRTTLLYLKNKTPEPACKHCGSRDIERLMSRFSHHKTEAARLKELDTSKRPDESFYRDNRNIGLWAKKECKNLV